LLLELNDYQSTNEVIMTNTRELAKNISFGRAPATTSAGFEDFQKEMNKMFDRFFIAIRSFTLGCPVA